MTKQSQDYQLLNRYSVLTVQHKKKVIFPTEDTGSAVLYSVPNSEVSYVHCIQYSIRRSWKEVEAKSDKSATVYARERWTVRIERIESQGAGK
jgi:hypothetical protein